MKDQDIIRRPLITEKTVFQQNTLNVYTFEVDRRANKTQIKEAVQRLFNVKVEKVNTQNRKGKEKRFGRSMVRRPDWKKAIVTVADGQQIEGV